MTISLLVNLDQLLRELQEPSVSKPAFAVTVKWQYFLFFSFPKQKALFQCLIKVFQKTHIFTCSCFCQDIFRQLQVQVCDGEQGHSDTGHTCASRQKDQSLKNLVKIESQNLQYGSQQKIPTSLKDKALSFTHSLKFLGSKTKQTNKILMFYCSNVATEQKQHKVNSQPCRRNDDISTPCATFARRLQIPLKPIVALLSMLSTEGTSPSWWYTAVFSDSKEGFG